MAKYVGLDKVQRAFQIIQQNGGIKASFIKLFRQVVDCYVT